MSRYPDPRITSTRVPRIVAPVLIAGILLSATTASADTQVNCRQNPGALHPAIAAAVPGSTLEIQGTCRGTDLVVQDTLIRGNRAFAVSAVGSGSAGAIMSGGTLAQVTTLINTEVFDNVAESGTFAAGEPLALRSLLSALCS